MSSTSYELSFTCKPRYLHAIATGVNSTENFMLYSNDVLQEAHRTDIRYVLIEDRLEGSRMSEIDLFTVIVEASEQAAGFYSAVAFVDEKIGDARYFAETVAVNRGIPVAIFDNTGDAERWLISQQDSNNEA